jgi:hypothetical protein
MMDFVLRTRINPFRRLGQLAPVILLAACGDGTGPSGWAGRWAVIADYTGGTMRCRVEATLQFSTDSVPVPNSYQDERVDCTDARVPVPVPQQSYSVAYALVQTNQMWSLTFVPYPVADHTAPDAPCAALRFDGSMGADHMGGIVHTLQLPCQGTYLYMQGTWRASRVAD